jgi:hypothetical protein
MTTHIVKNFKSQNIEMLFRAGDGVCIGQRKNETIVYGAEPNSKTSRVCLTKELASKYLREVVALEDLRKVGVFSPDAEQSRLGAAMGQAMARAIEPLFLQLQAELGMPPAKAESVPDPVVVIEEQDGEMLGGVKLYMPDGVMDLPGGIKPLN